MKSLHINSVDKLMVQPGKNSPPVDSSREDDIRSLSTSHQISQPAMQDTHSQRQLLPKSGIDTPLHVLPSSPIGPLENLNTYKPVNPTDISLPPANGTCSSSIVAAQSPADLSTVLRIMKNALPPDAMITVSAKRDMERFAVEFIQFLTSEGLSDSSIHLCHVHKFSRTNASLALLAAENAASTGRQTLEGCDVLEAMRKTGFENYAAALRPYLLTYRAEKYNRSTQKRNGNPDLEANGNDVGAAAGQDGGVWKSPQ